MSGHSIDVSKTSGGIPVVIDNIPDSESSAYMIGVATGSRDETKDSLVMMLLYLRHFTRWVVYLYMVSQSSVFQRTR